MSNVDPEQAELLNRLLCAADRLAQAVQRWLDHDYGDGLAEEVEAYFSVRPNGQWVDWSAFHAGQERRRIRIELPFACGCRARDYYATDNAGVYTCHHGRWSKGENGWTLDPGLCNHRDPLYVCTECSAMRNGCRACTVAKACPAHPRQAR
jgi:hypothetical protein